MRMCACYLDCHEAGLCCYLMIHIENLLRPLQLFYFHLLPIYRLSLVTTLTPEDGGGHSLRYMQHQIHVDRTDRPEEPAVHRRRETFQIV
jgi:hypothetical protein